MEAKLNPSLKGKPMVVVQYNSSAKFVKTVSAEEDRIQKPGGSQECLSFVFCDILTFENSISQFNKNILLPQLVAGLQVWRRSRVCHRGELRGACRRDPARLQSATSIQKFIIPISIDENLYKFCHKKCFPDMNGIRVSRRQTAGRQARSASA